MPTTMKAARIHAYGEALRIDEVPVPQPDQGQVQIAIVASGVCHTDIHATSGDMAGRPSLPFVPGHEIVGRVSAVGAGVQQIKEGDVVGVPSLHWACGECDYCQAGWETLCHSQLATGYSVDGGFAQFCVAPADFVTRIPHGVDLYEMAPILCAGVTTCKGLKQTGARKGDWVVISGIGGLGHVAVQYARALGYQVAVVDISDDKLELARRLGAELTVNAQLNDAPSVIQREIGGAHAVLVTAAAKTAFRAGVDMLRRGGVCVLCGLPSGEFPVPILPVVLGGLTVTGSIIGTRVDMDEAIAMAIEAGVKVQIEKQPLENINDIFARLSKGEVLGRVVLEIS
ncbi:MAG: zinc-dependent alcohol dehydrogenase [Candidatus Zixiibacteriota bacterium]|nr:MAG: zinc-dependent alcohol dehydrogenase [candidate division Zixibacteria bacterium]